MNDALSQYKPLREYLGVLRSQRWLIFLVVVIAVAAAVGISVAKKPTYEASAALSFQDQSQALGLVGVPVAQVSTPQQLALTASQTLITPSLLTAVQRTAATRQTITQLRTEISATAQSATPLLTITASTRSADYAARLANAVAANAVQLATQQSRSSLIAAARAMRQRFAHASDPTTRAAFADRISQLESLSVVTDPVTIAQVAQVPGSPASPKPIVDGIIAAILGLILGVGLAFLRNSLDHRMRGASEIQRSLGLPLIGQVRDEVLGHVALPNASGSGPVTEVDFEAFRILRANLDFLERDRHLRVIAITSGLPEEGKSTVAASLAVAYAESGKRALLVECDLRRPSLSGRLDLQREPGFTDFLSGDASPPDILRTVSINGSPSNGSTVTDERHLACIMAGKVTHRSAELLGSDGVRVFLEEVRDAYDVVIVDTSPLLPVADTLELVPHVDAVVLCVRAHQTTRQQALAAKAALERLPSKPTALVATGLRATDEEDAGYYAYAYAYRAEPVVSAD